VSFSFGILVGLASRKEGTSMSDRPPFLPTKEVRFAIVMYGGVSLAIYINGIAQEMLRLVRSTATDETDTLLLADDELSSTERVYRRLAQIAGRHDESGSRITEDTASPVSARFVIDVISGTSAGGINGIYLGKALANGQRIDALKRLWIDEADIQVLINDKKSVEPPLALQSPPQALLNGQRMYRKLLLAFDGMDQDRGNHHPLVEELDVFATTTDIEGVLVPIRLADGIVYERRHRNVFHFQSADDALVPDDRVTNDFERQNNPFLAFAARCTSSFPFAFEPMRLCDIDAVLDVTPAPGSDSWCRSSDQHWQRFYEAYLRPQGVPSVPFPERSFGDGGYLDNKPFSYAVETLMKRHADIPVERKLMYVEPSPDHPEDAAPKRDKPDAIENSLAALVTIPGYETIRGDLQTVLEHNRGAERVKRILAQIEKDRDEAAQRAGGTDDWPVLRPNEWQGLDLVDMLQRFGAGYVAYNRLKVSSVTDDLVSMFCRVLQIDEDSALFQAVRGLVRAWRDENYVAYRQAGLPTQNQYLLDFDVSYRLRRIRFVLNKVDDLARAEDALEVRQERQQIKKGILRNYQRLRRLERRLWPSRIDDSPLRAFTTNLGITVKDLEGFVVRTGELGTGRGNETSPCRPPGEHPIPEDECMKRAAEFLHTHPDQKQELDRAAAGLRELLRTVWLAPDAGEGLERLTLADGSPAAVRVRGVVRHYFDQYERYDLVLYPILFQSDVIGEGATVDVIRLSPEDATCLMVDRAEARLASPRPKLAGLTLGHFGGFVEAEWRRNDMMWGRLDAVERLITTILPDGKDEQARLALIDQAQRMVIREELSDEQRRKLYEKISEHGPSGDSLEYAKRILLDEKEALKDYRETLDRKPQPEGAARALARGTQVVGKMLEGIARKREIDTKRIAILTRMGRLLWGLVEVAVPRRLPELLFHYWVQLIYAFAAIMIVAGFFTTGPDVTKAGWIVLGGTLAVHLAAGLLNDYMRHRTGLLKAVKIAAVGIILVLAVVGAWHLWGSLGAMLASLRQAVGAER